MHMVRRAADAIDKRSGIHCGRRQIIVHVRREFLRKKRMPVFGAKDDMQNDAAK